MVTIQCIYALVRLVGNVLVIFVFLRPLYQDEDSHQRLPAQPACRR